MGMLIVKDLLLYIPSLFKYWWAFLPFILLGVSVVIGTLWPRFETILDRYLYTRDQRKRIIYVFLFVGFIFANFSVYHEVMNQKRNLEDKINTNKKSDQKDKSMEVKNKLLNFYERIIFLKESLPNDFNSEKYTEHMNETINEIIVFSDWITENAGALRTHIFNEITQFPMFDLEEALFSNRRSLDLNLMKIKENLDNLIENNKWKNYVNR